MARDSSFDDRRRQREREDEEEREALAQRKGGLTGPAASRGLAGDGSTEKLLELLARAEPLIEQVNNLYGQYIAGVEQRAPVERRKQLDQLMMTLQTMAKPTPAYQFRFQTLNQSYLTHRDRWERMCKDLESGKIKRTTGPKRGG